MSDVTPQGSLDFARAGKLFGQGRFREVLQLASPHLDGPDRVAWINLAAGAACAIGDFDTAEAHLRTLLALLPGNADVLSNHGNLLKNMGRLTEAEATLRKAITINPDQPVALNTLGAVQHELKMFDEAANSYRQAIRLAPGYTEARNNLAVLLKDMGHLAEAEQALTDLSRQQPNNADFHYNLGLVYFQQRRLMEAENAFKRALALYPPHVGAHHSLARILAETGRPREAERAYLEALALVGPAHSRKALERYQDHAELRSNFGAMLKRHGRYTEARQAYREALRLDPLNGNALCQSLTCSQYLCDWAEVGRESADLASFMAQGVEGITPFLLFSLPEMTASMHLQAASKFGEASLSTQLAHPPLVISSTHPNNPNRLRIGYLSADLQQHATMHLLAGVFAHHDPARLEIHAYSYGPSDIDDAHRNRVRNACEYFHDMDAMTDIEAARQIAEDSIDILIDLKGFTGNCRLGIQALRPAPIVVSWLGYPGSLGVDRLADYIVGDPIVTPLRDARHYSETLALMPNCYQPNDRERPIHDAPERAQFGLPDDALIFCSFNQHYKITEGMFDIWCRLLITVPGSVLWLLGSGDATENNLRNAATARGVSPGQLIFTQPLPQGEHLSRLQLADIALDTFPVGSHTTGSDALWAGVPLIARKGETFASRVSSSLLHAIGLPELITESEEDYFDLVVELATDTRRRLDIRAKLARNRLTTPLFDTERFTRDLERLYLAIWEQHGRGERAPIVLS
jgi:predicted O-linked N-acetylglucosamine transferase (SPINDLY family)